MSIRFQVKRTIISEKSHIREVVCICVADKENGYFIVHPISRFIFDIYPNSFNSQKRAAEEVKKFLNWIVVDERNNYSIDSFAELKIEHGVEYLNYLKYKEDDSLKTLSRSTLKATERYLTKFFYYLHDKNLLGERLYPEYQYNANGKKYLLSLFLGHGFTLPLRKNSNQITQLKAFPVDSLISFFIEVSRKVAPEITLGIYFQFFGGLRKGEVVNLTRASLLFNGQYGKDGITLDIKDNTKSLFMKYHDAAKNQVKKPRKQVIQRLPYIKELVKCHFDFLDSESNSVEALFINSKGFPMTGAIYENRFLKVKTKFLKLLEGSQFYSMLARTSWSTHIGRGIYTNLMAKLVSSPQELAVLRDDANLATAIGYMSEHKIQVEIEKGLEKMWDKGEFHFEH